jgi:hypothetical protein
LDVVAPAAIVSSLASVLKMILKGLMKAAQGKKASSFRT